MSLSKDLIFLILQFCDEENLKRTAHTLEQETGYFFDLKHFEELLLQGSWEEAETYLSSFTVVEDNKYSTKIYFEIRKHKFLEALDKREYAVALDILVKDLKVFALSNKELYKEMAQLLALDDFREHSSLALYGDTLSARKRMINELRGIIEANPLLQGKTKFPQINKSRLRRLINQSLNWQHIHCTHPHPQPHIDTLFTDHKCPGPDNILAQLINESSFPPLSPLMDNSTSSGTAVTESVVTAPSINLGDMYKKVAPSVERKTCDDTSKLKTVKPLEEVASSSTHIPSCGQESVNALPKKFPCTLKRVLNTGSSSSTTMDFHPAIETLLLVGKSDGEIELWDVGSAEKLFNMEFVFWEVKSVVSGELLEGMEKNPGNSANRVRWSPDGSIFGIAYSKCIIHLYSYLTSSNSCVRQLEIDGHVGSVNDLAFSKPDDKLVVISCGDDKLIKVWDAVTGAKQYTFEGHGAPVYSVCPHLKDNIHFLFSTSTNGEIKAWLFDNIGSRVTYYSPGFCSMKMAYSADGKRLFSCGMNKNGESYMVEWNESEGFVIRNYIGLIKNSSSMVQFDTCHNQFLAAGDDHLIKIWDMDNAEVLAVIDADRCLPAAPCICFSKNGNLLAVSANNNQIKVLANDHGHELLQTSPSFLRILTKSLGEISQKSVPVSSKDVVGGDITTEESVDLLEGIKSKGMITESTKVEIPSISKIVQVSSCQSMLLTSAVKANTIRRLVYTHSGNGILALAEDGTHLLWRWVKNGSNINGQATTRCAPQQWQPKSGLLMINDLPTSGLEAIRPCFSLSKNDSYVISASGGMISLYNVFIFKRIKNVMQAPPAATCIVFYPPDNNIIAIGMDDSTIIIYNIRMDGVIRTLQGHSKRISGVAFSVTLNVLVSCSVDNQIVVWDCVSWEEKKSGQLQISAGVSTSSEISIELDKDEKHFLVVHETQLSIHETMTLQRVKQWTIAKFCTRISHATYSCDGQMVYAAMRDGILLILSCRGLELEPRLEIDPSAYLPPRLRGGSDSVAMVAAHPHKACQFALGLSNGGVVVIEPRELQWDNWT